VKSKAENVVVSFKQLGDILLLEPTLRGLARQSGEPTHLITRPGFSPLVELMSDVKTACNGIEHYETLWCPHWGGKASLASFKTRAKRKILIVNKSRHLRWYHPLIFHERRVIPQEGEYWGKYHWKTMTSPNVEGFTPPALRPPPEPWAHSLLPNKPYILIHPTAAWQRKFWSAQGWALLIDRLHESGIENFVLTSGPADFEIAHCHEIEQRTKVPILNMAGKTTLKEYIHFIFHARGTLAIDGSSAHISAAFGKPTLSLFGLSNKRFWHWPTATSLSLETAPRTPVPPLLKTMPLQKVLDTAEKLLLTLA
jgi:ADP-heptose:LPS heptosyltransferase